MTKVVTEITKVAKNKKVIKTSKDPNNWWILSPAVIKFISTDNSPVRANVSAEIEYEEGADGQVTVSRISVQKSDKPEPAKQESTKSDEPKKSYDYTPSSSNRNESIERQCAVKTAVELFAGEKGVDINNADVIVPKVLEVAEKFANFIAKKN